MTVAKVRVERSSASPEITDAGLMNRISLGTLAAKSAASLPQMVEPQLGADGMEHLSITLSAQNGEFVEDLWLRKSADGVNWAYKYTVKRAIVSPGSEMQLEEKPLRSIDWTEPPTDVKTFKLPQ